MTNQDNPRNVKPYSLYPLTPEEALRKLVSASPADKPKEAEKKNSRKTKKRKKK